MKLSRRLRALAAALSLAAAVLAAPVSGQDFSNRSADDVDPGLRRALLDAVAASDSFVDEFDAEVWLTVNSLRLQDQVPNADERFRILTTVHRHATHTGLPPELVLAVIDIESNFDRYAISSARALGLMQVMPFWVEELGLGEDHNVLFQIESNILLGCRILKYYLDMEDGDLVQALARYNGSTGLRWYADRVLDRLRLKWYRQR